MDLPQRPLTGLVVGLSISNSADSAARGFPEAQVNRLTLQLVGALFGQGAGVMFGHDWRDDGVMEAVHGFAMQMQAPSPVGDRGAAAPPLLQNLIPWPDAVKLSEPERARLASTLLVEQGGLPPELAPIGREMAAAPPDDPRRQYLRARALTHLRHVLVARSHARLCMGGPTGGSQGRYPGIIEEAFLSVSARQPLYLAGVLGGAARQVIDAVEGGAMPEAFCPAPRAFAQVADLEHRGLVERSPATALDRRFDPEGVWQTLGQLGIKGLSEVNRLSPDENQELFHTPSIDRAVQLLLTGLSRMAARR